MRSLLALVLLALPALSGCIQDVFPGPVTPEDLVSDHDYTEWVIEIDYVQGHRPSTRTLNTLEERMSSLVHKDDIKLQVDDVLPSQGGAISVQDVLALKDKYQDQVTKGDTVVTWVVYLDGHSDQDNSDGKVLGFALSDHETVAIFDQTIETAAEGTLLNPSAYSAVEIEEAVVVHEFGHTLGLVNKGLPMQKDHEADSCNGESDTGHSSNRNSVMYCAVESSNLVQAFSGGLPTEFDSNDKADVCAAGGKC